MKIRQAVCIALLAFYMLMVLGGGYLEVWDSTHLPGSAQVQTGHVYRMTVNHGFVVYGTKAERQLLNAAWALFPFMIAIGITLGMLRPWFDGKPLQDRKWLVILIILASFLSAICSLLFSGIR